MTTPSTPPLPTRRIDAARHLFQPHHVRNSFALSSQPWLAVSAVAGLQAAATIGIAVPAFHFSPWSDLIGFGALGALVALFGRFAPGRRRNLVVVYAGIAQVLAVFCMSLAAWAGATPELMLVLLALSCGIFYFIVVTGDFGPPGALIFVFAAGASMHDPGSLDGVFARTLATGSVAVLGFVICACSDRLRHLAAADRPFPRDPLRPLSHRLIASARIAVGAGIAAYISYAVGAHHPSWAAMGALAVLQGAHLHITLNRAVQRMAGTVGGAVIAWLILSQDPSIWVILSAIVALQFCTELIIGANYGLGVIFVTPMALLMMDLAMSGGAAMVPERLLDTLLGTTIGLAIAILLSTLDDRHHLAQLGAERAAARSA